MFHAKKVFIYESNWLSQTLLSYSTTGGCKRIEEGVYNTAASNSLIAVQI
jgi:hypothetical protein